MREIHLVRAALVGVMVTGLVAVAAAPGRCQSVYLAPAYTSADWVRSLTDPAITVRPAITLRGFASGDTNVIGIGPGSRRHSAATTFTEASAWLTDFQSREIGIEGGVWRLSYSDTSADNYSGNRDAGQLYLDSLSHDLGPRSGLTPEARMNRTQAERIGLSYATPIRVRTSRIRLRVSGAYLRFHRLQLGTLTGATTGQAFSGQLHIQSTLGLPASDTVSSGATFDADLAGDISSRWSWSILAENLLSHLWQRKLQTIDGTLTTNTVQADPDGFLHGVPLLEGTIGSTPLDTDIHRRVTAGLAFGRRETQWLAFAHHDTGWRFATGVAARHGANCRWWLLGWLDPGAVEIGFESSLVRVEIGTSALQLDGAKHLTAAVTLRLPIGSLVKKRSSR